MKGKEYICGSLSCDYAREEYFQDTEIAPHVLVDESCPICGEALILGPNLKSNGQRWRHNDTNYN